LRAGGLRHSIELQYETRAVDSTGAPYPSSWTTYATVWAEIKGVSGTERLQYAQDLANNIYRIWIRYNRFVKASHRIVWGNMVLDILNVAPDNKSTRMEIIAQDLGGLHE
jgi:SPP1 family predicted phage head-tail adaptor